MTFIDSCVEAIEELADDQDRTKIELIEVLARVAWGRYKAPSDGLVGRMMDAWQDDQLIYTCDDGREVRGTWQGETLILREVPNGTVPG